MLARTVVVHREGRLSLRRQSRTALSIQVFDAAIEMLEVEIQDQAATVAGTSRSVRPPRKQCVEPDPIQEYERKKK